MKIAATISFNDLDSGDEAIVIVRYDDNQVSLALSLKADGDIQVVMDKPRAQVVLEALKRALQ